MWSAPHQPFVLPVRVRSFEDLYRGGVRVGPDERAVEKTLTDEVVALVGGAQARMSEALVAKLKEPNVKYVRVPNGLGAGRQGVGVASGQLYYLIKDIKDTADTTPEDELKRLLLTGLLGEGAVQVAKHPANNKDYFCAKLEDWTRVLGAEPGVQDV